MVLFRRKRDFAREVRRIVDQLVEPGAEVTQDDDDSIRIGDLVIGLENLRARWNRLADEERVPWLEETLPALISPPAIPTRLETTAHLRPGLRPRFMLESARLANLNSELSRPDHTNRSLIPFQPFGGDLVTVLLWDAPTTMSVVNQSQLDEWGARFQDLLPVAVDNLSDEPDAGWTAFDNRIWTSSNSDDYDGARMLIPGYLDRTGLAGELVVIHPNRNLLIVVAVDDAEGIATACKMALDDIDAPSPISFQPLVGRDDDWRPLVLPKTHPAHTPWCRLACLGNELNYRGLLQPLQQLVGDDLFIAPYELGETADGLFSSYTTWTEGLPSLLPRTDYIGLLTERGEAVVAEWDVVHRIVGTIMEPTDHYPELWRVMSFPEAADLARLRNLSAS